MVNWVAAAYGLAIPLQVVFALYALVFFLLWQRRQSKALDTETFVTARHSQGVWRIGWSFFAGAVGAWVVVAPGSFASYSGIVGVVVYAVWSGLPVLMIAGFGVVMSRRLAHVFSLSDYMGWRFGPIAKTLCAMVAVFNMSIAMLAEYTTIGSLFKDFVGSEAWPIILSVGVLTLIYTAYGGLVVSIATDQVQGMAAVVMTILLTIYVAVTMREPIQDPLPTADGYFNLGPNVNGYTSIFTMFVSLFTATIFSEAMWQRVWASSSKRTLWLGATTGAVLIIIVVFLSGFGSWLALASGLATAETNYNLYLFQLFSDQPNSVATLNSWVSLITVGLAVVMNEGAVDSLQNGIASSISSQWLKNLPLVYSRIAVLLLNVPLIAVGTRGFNVLSLFLITNLLCSCAAPGVVLGLIPGSEKWHTETSMALGLVAGILGLTATGIGLKWDSSSVSTSFRVGADWAWYSNGYDWRAFLAALCCSTGTVLLWDLAAYIMESKFGVKGPGISGVLMRIPGMRYVTGTPSWDPEGNYLKTRYTENVHGDGFADTESSGSDLTAKDVSFTPEAITGVGRA